MSGNILGERFVLVCYGESHGRAIGAVVDGCPAGLPIEREEIQKELDLRRPGTSSLSSPRKEEDQVEILSGIINGRTTGSPIGMLIWNKDVDSKPYERLMKMPRPGHADMPAWFKYGGFNDVRGGGHFSARLTATFVMGGVIAKKLLANVFGTDIVAYVTEIGGIRAKPMSFEEAKSMRYSNEVRCPDSEAAEKMKELILEEKKKGDSLGGLIECVAKNAPLGLGEPVFGSLDSDLARVLFSIPAVKGVEFGSGFNAARLRGSQNNDQYTVVGGKIVSKTNNAGGILGGLSFGMPIISRIAFKPPSSIPKTQKTVNLETMKEEELIVSGRHDPCVLPRAVPIVEAVVALVLADHAIRAGLISPVIGKH